MSREDPLKDHAGERQGFVARIAVVGGILALLIVVLLVRMAYLQVERHDFYSARSKDNRLQVQPVAPVRGLIYGRDGTVLADNKPAYRLSVVPEEVDNLKKTVAQLSSLLSISKSAKKRFFNTVGRKAPFQATNLRLDLTQKEAARFEVNQTRFPGVHIRAGLTRNYPLGQIGAHVIGYVGGITSRDLIEVDEKRYRGASQIGKAGIEKNHESRLHGYPGRRMVETNAAGRTLHDVQRQTPKPGDDLRLTLDAALERAAYRALGDKQGAVVALNPDTGGVLAMVSKPSFKPSLFADGISQPEYQKLLNAPYDPLLHRAIQGQYPPGSTIKPVMAIAGLATGNIKSSKKVYCPPYITLPHSDHRFRGWKRSGQGWVDLPQALQRSADVYFYKLGQKVGIDAMHRYATKFGVGNKTGIDLPHERAGVMPSRGWKNATTGKPWYPGETLNTVIGQGSTTVTPLQLATVTARIAKRGGGYKPHLLKAWRSSDGKTHQYKPQALKPITKPSSSDWQNVIKGMRMVVSTPRGTAYRYAGQNLDYPMAGKSGTAQVADLPRGPAPDESKVARARRPHALFIAFAPIDNPKIAVAAVVDHGGGGSSVAAPVAREVIDAYMNQANKQSGDTSGQWADNAP
ncbi:penicillin-binding protein 2 [Salinisphaera sp. USBA-960]|uniref:penicillin-binding protein 2 n=1 Tax=Salinisphaera orenii TaxID=856731 RepID=UPI000DBE029C|nr:penicillin-binding protein 2 [Salifodinibacter halophilus]NNC26935.1 penicillin-binding protein 2 [Salifodinibacter halophilus]